MTQFSVSGSDYLAGSSGPGWFPAVVPAWRCGPHRTSDQTSPGRWIDWCRPVASKTRYNTLVACDAVMIVRQMLVMLWWLRQMLVMLWWLWDKCLWHFDDCETDDCDAVMIVRQMLVTLWWLWDKCLWQFDACETDACDALMIVRQMLVMPWWLWDKCLWHFDDCETNTCDTCDALMTVSETHACDALMIVRQSVHHLKVWVQNPRFINRAD